jgi:conjugative relaxase-like TrwC/TraI family protein
LPGALLGVAVLRVTTLYASSAVASAQYYTRYLTGAPGEDAGVWTGRQAAALGLTGDVTTEQLQMLLEGRDPVSGDLLGRPLVDRVSSSGVVSRAVAGFDATLSAPKSLSVWWALSGDDGLVECHDVAVRAVVDCVERYGSTTRIRADGRRLHPETGGLTVAVFRQTTSRLDDPQLHSHVVISAKVQTGDGRWWALDARTLKGYQRALGGLYQSVLRAELTARYGVVFAGIVNGQAEIAGVPTDLLELFSKRTVQVDAAYREALAEFWTREGRDPTARERGALGRQAALDTRTHKSGTDATALRQRWQEEAAGIGVTADTLADSIGESAGFDVPIPPITVEQMVAQLSGERSAWHRFDVVRTVCDQTRPVPGVDGATWAAHLERIVDRVIADCVDLDPSTSTTRRGCDGRSVWIEPSARHHTSRQVLAQEEQIVSWALDAQHPAPRPADVGASGLDVVQVDAACAVAGEDRLVLIVGPAGTGKTTMLATAVTHLHAQGRPVFGVAPTAKAARVLGAETGMAADTVAKLLHEWTRPERPAGPRWRLPAGSTVIVDEAGMLNTRDLHWLTHLADTCRWRLVLVGDPHQLQAVGRGGMFTELATGGRTIELATIHRFTEPWEAAASLQLRHGNPHALDRYHGHGRIHAAPFDEHLDAIADTWLDHHTAGTRLAITAGSNDHVTTINHRVQHARRDAGHLGEAVDVPSGRLCVGDVITTRANRRHLVTSTGDMVRNRDYWTVDDITVAVI